MKPTMKNV